MFIRRLLDYRPVLKWARSQTERIRKNLVKQVNRTRSRLKKVFSTKKNKRKAIYIAGAVIIILLIGGVFTSQVHSQNKQKELQRIQNEKTSVLEALESIKDEKAVTETQLKEKAAREASMKARIEELEKALQAKAEQKRSLASRALNAVTFTGTVAAQGNCTEWMALAGIPSTYATNKLIAVESGCNPTVVNKSSGACGIPQALPCSKIAHCNWEPVCQLQWMDVYVKSRYGSWDAALAAWNSRYPHWY